MRNIKLEKALYKVFNNLFIKDRLDFYVEVKPHKFDENSYKIYTWLIINQSKYWKSSPNYSQEYFDFVMSIFEGDAEETFNELGKYVIHDKLFFTGVFYRLSNRGVYKPLFNSLKEMGIHYVMKESYRFPYPEIILDKNIPMTVEDVQKELNDEFNLDDILIYFG